MFGKNKHPVSRIDCNSSIDKANQAEAYQKFKQEAQYLKSVGKFLVPGKNGSRSISESNQRMIITKNDAFNTVRVKANRVNDEVEEDFVIHDISVNGGKIMIDSTSFNDEFSTEYPGSSLNSGTQSIVETREKLLSMMSEDQINALRDWIMAECLKEMADLSIENAV